MFAILLFLLCSAFCFAQDFNPEAPGGIYCDDSALPITDDWYGVIQGTGKILWVVCAPDSGALSSLDDEYNVMDLEGTMKVMWIVCTPLPRHAAF